MPHQWRNLIWQSLEEYAGKRCSECGLSVSAAKNEVGALVSLAGAATDKYHFCHDKTRQSSAATKVCLS